ncbi:hypothetical protein PROFUN_03483 [Planoprotostelium fungivorum]|uniref:Uncharacterized protein n=1 Tax=Planoprotostelium fungivorum TaxID=1890364 RepID=A0A2P6MN82_9EUKA|nr:hypothetical protein PROFUN_03483 [Planoprotostelium fungivorum]
MKLEAKKADRAPERDRQLRRTESASLDSIAFKKEGRYRPLVTLQNRLKAKNGFGPQNCNESVHWLPTITYKVTVSRSGSPEPSPRSTIRAETVILYMSLLGWDNLTADQALENAWKK